MRGQLFDGILNVGRAKKIKNWFGETGQCFADFETVIYFICRKIYNCIK